MMTPGMIERIRKQLFPDAKARKAYIDRFMALNDHLNKQLKAQQMTPELLEKRCTL